MPRIHASGTFRVGADQYAVAACLGDPRNLILANHPKPILERSDDRPTQTGSWAIIGLDNIRMRVDYVTFSPTLIEATIAALAGDRWASEWTASTVSRRSPRSVERRLASTSKEAAGVPPVPSRA